MYTSNDLDRTLLTMFEENLNVSVPSPETDLLDTGLLNSVSFVELVMLLEERFGVTVPLDELELDQFRTIRQISAFVAQLMAATSVEAA